MYGVHGTELKWFNDYLHDRQQSVKIGEVLSDWTSVRCGVPQGSILGPLLFILYINDLPVVVKHSKLRMYADDTSLTVVKGDKRELEDCLMEDLIQINK